MPIGIVTFALGSVLINETKRLGLGHGVDVAGAALVTVALMLGVYTIVKVTDYGWLSAHTLGFGAGAVGLLAVFVAVESRLSDPMFPLRILRVPGLAGSSVVRGFVGTGMYSTFLLGVLYLQHVHGYGALRTGLAFLPLTLLIGLFSLGLTAWLVSRFGATRVVLAGLAALAAALVLLSQLPTHTSYFPAIALPFALLGLGAGLSFLPLTTIAMADVPTADAGLASGILNASQQISVAIGTAALGMSRPSARTCSPAGDRTTSRRSPAAFTWAGRSAPARSPWAHWSPCFRCAPVGGWRQWSPSATASRLSSRRTQRDQTGWIRCRLVLAGAAEAPGKDRLAVTPDDDR